MLYAYCFYSGLYLYGNGYFISLVLITIEYLFVPFSPEQLQGSAPLSIS
jgi:hypothetical protein